MEKLNLGCGEFKKEGFINVDYYSVSSPDVKHNLNLFPYPFNSNQFEYIEMSHLLEHLDNPFQVIREVHRIARSGAILKIKVPHFSRGFSHPEHKAGFDVTLPFYFNPKFKGGYQGVELCLKKLKLNWFSQPELKKSLLNPFNFFLLNTFGKIVNFFANISPYFCSRFWCYFVGGFEEIEFTFKILK